MKSKPKVNLKSKLKVNSEIETESMSKDKDIPWSAKYMNSDHHTDRSVMSVVCYEHVTGVDHPTLDPNLPGESSR